MYSTADPVYVSNPRARLGVRRPFLKDRVPDGTGVVLSSRPGRFRLPAALSAGLVWLAALAVVACCVSAPSALGFGQVTGSPFTTGADPRSVAFSPGGGLLATANFTRQRVGVLGDRRAR